MSESTINTGVCHCIEFLETIKKLFAIVGVVLSNQIAKCLNHTHGLFLSIH